MRKVHAGVLFIYCQTLLGNLAAPQICLAQGSSAAQEQGVAQAAIPRASPELTERSAALPFSPAPAPAPGLSASTLRPQLSAASVRQSDSVFSQAASSDGAIASPSQAMPAAPQQAGTNVGATTSSAQGGSSTAGQSGLLASDGTGSGGGTTLSGDGNLSGQGTSAGGGAGGVSDTASLGNNPGSLVFDGAGNLVSGVQSAFGDVPSTYTGRQEWPELVGTNALLAKAKLKAETSLNVLLVPKGSVVTTDYRADRIRIYFDPATYLVVQPRPSVG